MIIMIIFLGATRMHLSQSGMIFLVQKREYRTENYCNHATVFGNVNTKGK